MMDEAASTRSVNTNRPRRR